MTDSTRQKLFDDTDDLQRTMDELRVQMHLAAADSRVHWESAQQGFHDLQRVVGQLKAGVAEPLTDMNLAARRLVDQVRGSIAKIRS